MILDLGKVRHKKIEYEVNEKGCWICTSHCKDKDGYAKIFVFNNHLRLHRYVYTILKGDIPENMVIRHKCDNPSCINPEHLEVGTVIQNVLDKIKRGRMPKSCYDNLEIARHKRGQDKAGNKLTETQVLEIFNSKLSHSKLSNIYNISPSNVYKIKHKKSWGWLTP